MAAAAAARLERGPLLHEGRHRFVVLIEETVLRYRIGTPPRRPASSTTTGP
ncbi:hypothetical protein [Kitasatospora cineracea]|uniref:hypothetical protein n=1 Tax=Kitasatospora cineracea TaxID=88074 RepID=UPI0013C314A3|nr:hypothetical protein [Kitasatospora cineracea]